jgi:hypothetical protein
MAEGAATTAPRPTTVGVAAPPRQRGAGAAATAIQAASQPERILERQIEEYRRATGEM